MTLFPIIKHLHVWCVVFSIALYLLRFNMLLRHSERLSSKFFKIAPHCIDTALLCSGIAMAILLRYSPFTLSWFSLKLVLIMGYIAFGMLSFKSTRMAKPSAVIALVLFISVAYLAINKPSVTL